MSYEIIGKPWLWAESCDGKTGIQKAGLKERIQRAEKTKLANKNYNGVDIFDNREINTDKNLKGNE